MNTKYVVRDNDELNKGIQSALYSLVTIKLTLYIGKWSKCPPEM